VLGSLSFIALALLLIPDHLGNPPPPSKPVFGSALAEAATPSREPRSSASWSITHAPPTPRAPAIQAALPTSEAPADNNGEPLSPILHHPKQRQHWADIRAAQNLASLSGDPAAAPPPSAPDSVPPAPSTPPPAAAADASAPLDGG
jgi:hypothetical protein